MVRKKHILTLESKDCSDGDFFNVLAASPGYLDVTTCYNLSVLVQRDGTSVVLAAQTPCSVAWLPTAAGSFVTASLQTEHTNVIPLCSTAFHICVKVLLHNFTVRFVKCPLYFYPLCHTFHSSSVFPLLHTLIPQTNWWAAGKTWSLTALWGRALLWSL